MLFSALIAACIPSLRASRYAWQLVLEIGETGDDKAAAVPKAIAVIQRRLEIAGVSDFTVGPTGTPQNPQILVNLPAGVDLVRLKQLMTTHGRLEFVSVISPQNPFPVQTYQSKEEAIASTGERLPPGRRVLPYKENEQSPNKWIVVEATPIFDGSQLRDASAMQLRGDDYTISFTLKPEGAKALGDWTESHIRNYMAVVWNGEVKSVAYVISRISEQGQITGKFTKQAAEDMVLILRSGALPGPLRIVSEENLK